MKTSCIPLFLLLFTAQIPAAALPNILWITSEDNGPHLGCYGDRYADTPHIDSIARKGMLYRTAWSTAPVCAPARTTIISGMYPPSTGSQHMRSMTRLPEGIKMYPQYLRALGYYCTNKSKEDYNLEKPGTVWDAGGHWKGRKPGQPFFAIFNHTISHESKLRTRPHTPIHDPAKVRVPAYHPDTPEVRQDWAQYYDRMTEMDALVGKNLQELAAAGLEDDTIIFYYGDHGSGMPRSKRWPYSSGLRVPMIVHVPAKWKHLAPKEYTVGGSSERLVGFIDLAPTLLSIAGMKPPAHLQGHAFMGKYETAPPKYQFGFRGRMDERYDLVRSVTDGRYVYLKHYNPHKVYGQYIQYMFQTPTTRIWKDLFDAGKLNPAQSLFWQTKPAEELYDLQQDPDEVRNLADSPKHQAVKQTLAAAQRAHLLETRDLGFLPETEIHSRAKGGAPRDMGLDPERYPLEKILAAAERASSLKAEDTAACIEALGDADSAVRYWGAMGLLMREDAGVKAGAKGLVKALDDAAPNVAVAAAEALGRYGNPEQLAAAHPVLLRYADISRHGIHTAMQALNAIDFMDERARPIMPAVLALPQGPSPARHGAYIPNLMTKAAADLGLEAPAEPKKPKKKPRQKK